MAHKSKNSTGLSLLLHMCFVNGLSHFKDGLNLYYPVVVGRLFVRAKKCQPRTNLSKPWLLCTSFINTVGEQTYVGMASCDTPLSRVLRRHTVFHHWLVQGYRRCVSYPPYRDHRLLSMRSSYPSLPSFRQLENRPTIKRRLGRNEEFLIGV